jgi:DNA primase
MPMVDFRQLKAMVSLRQVLDLLHWTPTRREPSALRGPCPVHRSKNPHSRSFAAGPGGWTCFSCGEQGDQIRLWALCRGLTQYQAALDLCRELRLPVPTLPARTVRRNGNRAEERL